MLRLATMAALRQLLEQRSTGRIDLRLDRRGVAILREEGAAKCRIPRGSSTAILINSSGGLAGGDSQTVAATAGVASHLTLTTQAAERVYRSLGPAADVSVSLAVEKDATLHWLPQEMILFDGSALKRRISVDLAADATFLALEALVLGRTERKEILNTVSLFDSWSVRCAGRLIHAERLVLGPDLPRSLATLGDNQAMATVLLVAPQAERWLPQLRDMLGPSSGISAWSVGGTGKLVARLLACDGYSLRKMLVPALCACVAPLELPKVWTM